MFCRGCSRSARRREYVERGRKIAVDFACWFDRSGEALAYGRSLTYRFAQGAFYAALALAEAETEQVNYGQMKHLLLGNMRKWFAKPIFTRDGVLTIGYGYPSLLMAEGYNAPGSPYWAMKAFACLALPEEHPFWQAEEQEIDTPKTALQPHARMLITRSDDKSHVTAFVAGNRAHEHSHDEAKYEKFVYSSVFGFSVSKAQKLLKDGAFDNMLALSEDGDTWHPRDGCDGSVVYAQHARTPEEICENGRAAVIAPWGVSGVMNLSGYDGQQNVMPEPNTNLMAPRTLIPTLTARIGKGETVLVSAVFGTKTAGRDAWENPPTEVLTYGKMD